jgi:hypothetical protein
MRSSLGGALEDVLTPLLDPAFRLGTLLLGDAGAAGERVHAAVAGIRQARSIPAADTPAAFLGGVFDACRPGRPVGSGDDPPLVRAIGRLPAEDRAALFLYYWLRLAPAEVAAATGIHRDEISQRLNLLDRFGGDVRPRDVSAAFEELTQPAPYGFEHRVLRDAVPVARRREAPPLAWTGIAALALAGLLLVIFAGSRLVPSDGRKVGALAHAAISPSPAATALPSPPPAVPASAPSPSPTPPATTCSLKIPQEPAVAQPVAVSAVRTGSDAARDRFVVQLDGPVPPFDLQPAAGGWLLTLSGAGQGPSLPTDLKTGYQLLTEAKFAGGAAGSVGWSLSVSSTASCPAVSTLSGPSRIVVDFPHG